MSVAEFTPASMEGFEVSPVPSPAETRLSESRARRHARMSGAVDPYNSIYTTDTETMIMHEAGSVEQLSHEENLELFAVIAHGRAAATELANENHSPSAARRVELEAKEDEAQLARHRLMNTNLRLVVKIARTTTLPPNYSWLDAFQEGAIALNSAIDTYDPSFGTLFGTHATTTISGAIKRHSGYAARTIKLTKEARALLKEDAWIEAHPDEAAQIDFDTNTQDREYAKLIANPAWLDSQLHNDGNDTDTLTLGDTIPSDEPTPVEAVLRIENVDILRDALDTLSPTQNRAVVSKVFGERGSVTALARELGVSSRAVGQASSRGLAQLRTHLEHQEDLAA